MKSSVLDYLQCPSDGHSLRLETSPPPEYKNDEIFAGKLICGKNHSFGIERYIADLTDPLDHVVEDSDIYDELWEAHSQEDYRGRDVEYSEKLRNLAVFPEPLKRYFDGNLVLDAGCGQGRFTYLASRLGASHVVAVDYSKTALELAITATHNPPNCSFVRASLTAMPFSCKFDHILCIGALHHVPQPNRCFQELTQLLKRGGHISLYVFRTGSLPKIFSLLRVLSLRMDKTRIRNLCEQFGLGYGHKSKLKFRIGKIIRRIVGNLSYEGLTTPYIWEQSEEEVRQWCLDSDIELISINPRISILGRKK